MLVKYKKQANISAGVWLITLILLIAVIQSTKGNMWESGDVGGIALLITNIGSFWFSFWAYAKAKGYSGLVGLVLPLLSVLGLVILAMLRDKHPESATTGGITKAADDTRSLEENLRELKRLNDSGLISQEVYLEQQRKLLTTSK